MPPKKGRGRGRGIPYKPAESIPNRPESDQRGGYRGRSRGEKYASSFETGEAQSPKHQYEKSRDCEPSTSGYKDSHREHKAASEDTRFPVKQSPSDKSNRRETHKFERASDYHETHRDCAYKVEKPHDFDTSKPSISKHKDNFKERKVAPEDFGFKFGGESSQTSLFPVRPGIGRVGRHIKVVSNCYPIEFPTGYVYHYDIEVIENTPRKKSDSESKKYRCLNTKRNREVIAYMLATNTQFKGFCAAFDGNKNLLTREMLNVDLPYSCTVVLPNEIMQDDSQDIIYDNFRVEVLSLVSKINLDSIMAFYQKKCNDMPQEAIMALEIILRHNSCLKFTPVFRSFYYPDRSQITPFGGGLEIWFGYHQGIRLGQWAPTVNLDISATTFWKSGPVLDFIADQMNMSIQDLRNLRSLNRNVIRRLNKKLKQRQVKVTHLRHPRKYRVIEMRNFPANQEYIDNRGNNNEARKTVAQYFKETYGKELVFGNLPCLQVQPIKKNIFIPIEVCEFVEGQHYKGELTTEQGSKLIESTSKSPYERFKEIEKIVHVKANFKEDKVVQNFGIKISDKPVIADARILDSPNLVYKDRYNHQKMILPRDGTWDVRNTQFFEGAVISSWVLLSFHPDRNLEVFADLLSKISRNLGMKLGQLSEIKIIRNSNCDKKQLFKDLKEKGNELAVIVIPRLDEREEKKLYAEIKKVAETEIGLTTQCLKSERLRVMDGKRGPQIASNLCLKINAKLGGENHSLYERDLPSILCKPVVIIGADVNHPAPTQPNQPSIAACVASLDCFGKRFAVSIRAQVNSKDQKKKIEEILALEDMVYELLLAFYQKTRRKKPEKIIFFRDGVSEGELTTVKNKEVLSIRKACRRLERGYEPGITAIVVQKRHHVRFMPKDQREGVGRKGNLPPGTVIDTDVTHPRNFDFFMASQYGLQGTSRPSHYLVLEDDNNLSPDEVEKLTYHMCHMYVRCTKTISIPAPVAYADLVAYRARRHLESKKDDSSSSRDCSKTYRLTQDDINAIQVVNELKDSMYFV